jgi:hypothetical protein
VTWLAREYPGALVRGELVVDAPELLRLAVVVVADQLATIEFVGGTVKVKYRAICLVGADLREPYVTGSLVVKRLSMVLHGES